MSIRIVTVATHRDGYLDYLEQSCSRHGSELIILGVGSKWNSYFDKYEILYQNLNMFDENDIICFVDAYDVIMIDDTEKLRHTFLDFVSRNGRKIIMAHETFGSYRFNNFDIPFVNDILSVFMDTKFSSLKGLNPGTMIGFMSDIRRMIEELRTYIPSTPSPPSIPSLPSPHSLPSIPSIPDIPDINTTSDPSDSILDDQVLVNRYNREHPNVIYDDVHSQFFFISYELMDLEDFRGMSGFFIHRPGNLPFGEFLRHRGYHISSKDEMSIFVTSSRKIVDKLQYYFSSFK